MLSQLRWLTHVSEYKAQSSCARSIWGKQRVQGRRRTFVHPQSESGRNGDTGIASVSPLSSVSACPPLRRAGTRTTNQSLHEYLSGSERRSDKNFLLCDKLPGRGRSGVRTRPGGRRYCYSGELGDICPLSLLCAESRRRKNAHRESVSSEEPTPFS
jgi:hypothetical protein